jgi:predicted neutral ceramidase superfamily lipid hydrolase
MNGQVEEKVDQNIFLANLIRIFHILIILFVLIAPFTNLTALLILHITFCISLLVHWLFNSNECSLTLLESQLRGLPRNESFSYKFISPIYNISNTDWSYFCYIITISLMCVSIYKLYHSDKVAKTIRCFSEKSKDESSTYKKTIIFFDCFKDLLILE